MPPWSQWPNLDWLVQVKSVHGSTNLDYQNRNVLFNLAELMVQIGACQGQSIPVHEASISVILLEGRAQPFFFEKKSSTFGVKKNRILSGNDRLEGTDLLVWLVVADVFLAASHQIPPGLHMLRFPFYVS